MRDSTTEEPNPGTLAGFGSQEDMFREEHVMKTTSFYKNGAVLSVTGITLGLGAIVLCQQNRDPSLCSG